MSQRRDWKVYMKAEESPQNDSLELGDSWREMPRRAQGVVNKTNGLYRRSALPQQSTKNLYNFIIEKKPIVGKKTIDPDPVNEAPETDPPELLISDIRSLATENGENTDTLNFSEFLSAQTDGPKATTSTPYPVRQIDINKTPKRPANAQLTAADSPKKLFVPTPSRIPVTTPRTSRQPSNSGRRAKLSCDRKKMLSPSVVSSTVDIVSENEESEPVEFPEEEARVNENADQNCLPFDEDQQEQDAGTKNSDEAVFRRPELVRRPLLKQDKLDADDDQPKISNTSNISQRNKKSRPMVNPLLEDYMKVGESIINRTNGLPLENSSSSTRRKLYRKGDSCNEEDIVKDIVPINQPSFVLNPISAGDNGTFTKAKSISVQSNGVAEGDLKSGGDAAVVIRDAEDTAEPRSNAVLKEIPALPQSGTEHHDAVDLTFDDSGSHNQSDDRQESTNDEQSQSVPSNDSPLHLDVSPSDDVQEYTNDKQSQRVPSNDSPLQLDVSSNDDVQESTIEEQSQSASSNEKQNETETENGHSKANCIDQLSHVSAEHSNKQVLEEILEDWSDRPVNHNEDVDRFDAEKEVQPATIEKPSTEKESNVRQARSHNKKTQSTGTTSSKTSRRGAVRSTLQKIEENAESEEDDLSTSSVAVRNLTKNASVAKRTRKEVLAKSQSEPVHSTQQEVVENEYLDSEQMVEEPSSQNVKLLSTKPGDVKENKIQPKKKGNVVTDGSEVELPSKSKSKANNKRLNVDGNEPGADRREKVSIATSKEQQKKTRVEDDVTGGTDDEIEEILSAKRQTKQTRKKGLNVGNDVIETDGRTSESIVSMEVDVTQAGELVTQPVTTSKGEKRKKRGNVEDDETEAVELATQPATTSKGEKRKKRANVVDDETEAVELATQPATTSKGEKRKKRANVVDDETEAAELVTQQPTTSNSKEKKKRPNAEDDVLETDGIEAVLPTEPQSKTRKKRADVEVSAAEEPDEPPIEVDDYSVQDDTGNEIRPTAKSKVRKSRKRKLPTAADASNVSNGDFPSTVDGSMAKKRRKVSKLSKWEKWVNCGRNTTYDSLKPREADPGVRQSTRERRLPTSNLLITIPKSTNQSALQSRNGSVQPSMRRTQSANSQSQNVFSMLLNGSMDREPPLITHLEGIEITQGFHKTVKNNLVIHHIPGETGPSYGYFTLEPGMVKRTCRISWNLHIHVVSGPVQIITNGKTEQMVTGSFASLPTGTKYSLRNDSENSTLVFFSQHLVS